MIYIFDIDGTLADLSHRLHFIEQKPADWQKFFAACPDDKPIPEVSAVLRALAREHTIFLISGRSDEVRDQTEWWMAELSIPYARLLMRKAGDHRPDNIVKEELFDALMREYQLHDFGGVFEDRKQVVDMYRAKGLRVFQVAEGNF